MTIGTSIIDMEHFKKLTAKPRFLAKYYSPQEMKFLMEKNFSVPIMAEMFAAKAAFVKALGINAHGVKLNDVSVLTDYSGAYYLSLTGKAKIILVAKKYRTLVSCSHHKISAISTIILYD